MQPFLFPDITRILKKSPLISLLFIKTWAHRRSTTGFSNLSSESRVWKRFLALLKYYYACDTLVLMWSLTFPEDRVDKKDHQQPHVFKFSYLVLGPRLIGICWYKAGIYRWYWNWYKVGIYQALPQVPTKPLLLQGWYWLRSYKPSRVPDTSVDTSHRPPNMRPALVGLKVFYHSWKFCVEEGQVQRGYIVWGHGKEGGG